MTTTNDITSAQIRTLRSEAAEAGDLSMVATCDGALAGDDRMRVRCAEAIREAAAQNDEALVADLEDEEGNRHEFAAATVEGIHKQIVAAGLEGKVTVRDEAGFVRGWASHDDWRCA